MDPNPSIILNYSSKLRPLRGKCSLIDIEVFVRKTTPIFGRFTIFYRYTAGFRPYLIDFQFNACEVMDKKSALMGHKAFMILYDLMKKIFSSLFSGCPYEGLYHSVPWFDINETLSPFLPPVVPTGVYRIQFKFDAPSNITIIIFQTDVLLKATREFRATDFSFLNMG